MQIERTDLGTTTIIRMAGDIDNDSVSGVRDVLYDCLSEGRCNLVLNVSDVRFLSYMGLGVLVERLRMARKAQGDIKLVGANLYMQRLFRMTGTSSLFDTFDSEPQAVGTYEAAA